MIQCGNKVKHYGYISTSTLKTLTSIELTLLGTTPTAVSGIGSPDARRRRRKQHKARFTTPSTRKNKAFNRFTIKEIAIT
jgi:hypothetical protein